MDQATSVNTIPPHQHCFTQYMPYDRTHKYRVCQDNSCRELEIIEVKA